MAIQFSGSASISTFLGDTKQHIINNVGAALLAAGWSTVSGGTGTSAWKLQSATTGQGYAMRVLMQDNSGNCITFSVESSDGALVGGNSTTVGGGFLIPDAAYTYEVICSAYQCFIALTPYQASGRTAVGFGVPYVNAWDTGSVTRIGWMQGNGQNDTDVVPRASFRTVLASVNSSGPAMQGFLNSNLYSGSSSGQQMVFQVTSANSSFFTVQTISGRYLDYDALLSVPPAAASNDFPQLCVGQLWDAFVASINATADQSFTQSGHNWINFTNSNGAGTICLATS